MLFRRLRSEDILLDNENIDEVSEEMLKKICFARGININQPRKGLLEDLKLWLSISMKSNIPHTLLLLIRIHDFNQDQFKVDEDET